MEFIPIAVLLATVKKLVDFVRFLRAGDVNGVITQVAAWAAGFLVVALAAHTPWAAGLVFGGFALSKLGVAAQLLVGVTVGSAASFGKDVVAAVDNSQSAAVPPLIR
jgi:hypothetical protein